VLTWIYFAGCCGLLGRLHPSGFPTLDAMASHFFKRDYDRDKYLCQLETDDWAGILSLLSARLARGKTCVPSDECGLRRSRF
jgi:hypothetical protein